MKSVLLKCKRKICSDIEIENMFVLKCKKRRILSDIKWEGFPEEKNNQLLFSGVHKRKKLKSGRICFLNSHWTGPGFLDSHETGLPMSRQFMGAPHLPSPAGRECTGPMESRTLYRLRCLRAGVVRL